MIETAAQVSRRHDYQRHIHGSPSQEEARIEELEIKLAKAHERVADLDRKLDGFQTLLHEAAYSACKCTDDTNDMCAACEVVKFMQQDEERP